ncbi:hypothetical protein AB0P21_09205 [Kribbella sp. NPDC056861]|uniref:hypothetical protein n=1 Tax=Kribbella sp. NPDC056861 TaxID=3154857 RepID=UPI0034167A94
MSTPTTPGPDDKPKQSALPPQTPLPKQTPLPPQTPLTPAASTTPATSTTPAASTPPAAATSTGDAPAGAKAAAEADTQSIPAQPKAAKADEAKPKADGAKKGPWWKAPLRWVKGIQWRRNPWVTVGGVVLALLVVAAVGYFGGLGPMSRLNTARGIEPPAKLAGLDRVTDTQIREQLKLDQTRDALSRINDGKQATVEAYGNLDGQRLFVVIALRGKVDIDKTIKDSGATPEMVKEVGQSTCVESSSTLPTQCYRGSNTLTVIAQAANDGVSVNDVGPLADEAFTAMK